MTSASVLTPWGKIAARSVSLLLILHKCHEYFQFCDNLSDLMNRLAQIKATTYLTDRTATLALLVNI